MKGSIGEFGHLARLARAPDGSEARALRTLPVRGAPLVGVVRNPRSHRNKGHLAELADCANILVETPRSHSALRTALENFAARGIDFLAVDGGDGTVRDVLTCGSGIFGREWPPLIVLPKGKTNALAVDLGLPNAWTLPEAMEALRHGKMVVRRPLTVTGAGEDGSVQGFILGAGIFTVATQAGQEAHRWGAFNSFAVGLTVLWALLQTLFGRAANPWRQGVEMRLRCGRDGDPLPHSGLASRDERFIMFASTLERFPLGMRPFGGIRSGLKLAAIDAPVRWLLALLPVMLTGWNPRFLERFGFHRMDASAVEIELADRFILDGEYFPAGSYRLRQGPELRFVVP